MWLRWDHRLAQTEAKHDRKDGQMTQEGTKQGRRDFVKYSFYKIDPEWRRLPELQRSKSKSEFAEVLAEASSDVTMAS